MFITYDNDGRFVQEQNLPELIAGATGVLPLLEGVSSETHYIDDGKFCKRPASAIIATTGNSPLSIDLSVLAAGTSVEIRNETDETMTITDLSEDLTLTDAGLYKLHANQKFPYHNIYLEISVA